MNLSDWEPLFEQHVRGLSDGTDPAHDLAHFRRVVRSAKQLAGREGGDPEIVVPAAWLHDFVLVPKDSPQRPHASRIAADGAAEWLRARRYPERHIPAIHHAIHAHSFTARVPTESIEAKIVQDADRLDAVGAVGLSRCLMLGAVMKRPLYDEDEPFPDNRPADDKRSAIDHFYTKLLGLAATMQTDSGRREAERRTEFLRAFLEQLRSEIG